MKFIERAKSKIKSTLNLIKFIYFIQRAKLFSSTSPEVILPLIGKFLELQWPFYTQRVVFNRTPEKSSKLLQALIGTYLDSKSNVTLDQILTVLKEEFIKRENNGRKQFQIR